MTKNTYNPYEIMMDKYDKEEMLSDVREAMLYQLGVDVSCEELNHFFTGKGKAALLGGLLRRLAGIAAPRGGDIRKGSFHCENLRFYIM